jgi:TetR/AcrR family acrAB operon transcriptional repressor
MYVSNYSEERTMIMRRTKEEALLTREQVLRAALRVFRSQGYAASTLDEIAREAGVTRGAVYGHFEGKAALYQTLVQENFASMSERLVTVFSEGGTAQDILRQFIVRSLTQVEDDDVYQGIIELTMLKADPGIDQTGDVQKKQQGTQALLKQLEHVLQSGVETGEVRAGQDLQHMARSFLALVNGAILLWFQTERAFSLKSFASTLAETALHGVLVPE